MVYSLYIQPRQYIYLRCDRLPSVLYILHIYYTVQAALVSVQVSYEYICTSTSTPPPPPLPPPPPHQLPPLLTTTTQYKLDECKCSICASSWMKKHHQHKLQRVIPPIRMFCGDEYDSSVRIRVENGGNQKANFMCNKTEGSIKTSQGLIKISL